MQATRARVAAFIEWAVAAACIAALLAIGSVIVREFRTVRAVIPVSAREAVPPAAIPAGVPPRAVSVPMLLLPDGKDVHVGDTLSAIASRLGRQGGSRHAERLTRFYEHAGIEFVLVFEPFQSGAKPRIAAIYLQ
jgi:hypothetical protein